MSTGFKGPGVEVKKLTSMIAYFDSPIGFLEITASEHGIGSLYFREGTFPSNKPSGVLKNCFDQLAEYFEGKRKIFSLDLDPEGTDFQKKVWNELLKIPFGETISYLELSKRLGDVKAIRAVGNANGKNPVSVIVPCHRVIGTNGKLIGYGGGLWRKRWLLEFERSFVQKDLFSK
jgi:methylated-DNA-[protein]-cysteine S-methyltransferase